MGAEGTELGPPHDVGHDLLGRCGLAISKLPPEIETADAKPILAPQAPAAAGSRRGVTAALVAALLLVVMAWQFLPRQNDADPKVWKVDLYKLLTKKAHPAFRAAT